MRRRRKQAKQQKRENEGKGKLSEMVCGEHKSQVLSLARQSI
jgi:hypothetical protein